MPNHYPTTFDRENFRRRLDRVYVDQIFISQMRILCRIWQSKDSVVALTTPKPASRKVTIPEMTDNLRLSLG